jgi:hypothetical protein
MGTVRVLGMSPGGSRKVAGHPGGATALELSVETEPGIVVVNAKTFAEDARLGTTLGPQPRYRPRSRAAPDWLCQPVAQAGNCREVLIALHQLPRERTG